jgi:Fur family transcriptional regulator, peroxide stress response regulator
MKVSELRSKLMEKGIKVTPQRMAVLEAFGQLGNHPTAENIITYIRKSHPNIALATVYKVLDTLVENGLVNKVKTERDIMRYDHILEKHHHLYTTETDRIEDYIDDELNEIIAKYFEKIEIPGFLIEDIKLQIIGKFK